MDYDPRTPRPNSDPAHHIFLDKRPENSHHVFQKYLLFGTNVFRESIAHTRLTKTQLRQNQRIMELKIVLA
jgi:hypothetical protein